MPTANERALRRRFLRRAAGWFRAACFVVSLGALAALSALVVMEFMPW